MMQASSSFVTLEGNVASEPELRMTTAGIPVTNFRLASSDSRKNDETGEWVDVSTVFMKVACWRSLARNVVASVRKGDPVVVVGRLKSSSYMWEEQQRTSTELVASIVGPNLSRGYAVFHRVAPGSRAPLDVQASRAAEPIEGPPAAQPVPLESVGAEAAAAEAAAATAA
ncbi:MAG TPA: single-stranded DNA-binding protein [Mycobacteriales bacterium]|jgi:single-strand DNA-binding protein|nr:single-stranded DNA-binding protein [Mycobacteriales bacterium]